MRPSPELRRLLEQPRYEVIPLAGAVEQVVAHVPKDIRLTVTVSPTRGLEPSLDTMTTLASYGYRVVPHLSARLIRDEGHLREVVIRCREVAADAFVIAGDPPEPAGLYESAADLLRALERVGHPFTQLGIAGYPEGHALVDQAMLDAALAEKAPVATYLTTQMCFHPASIHEYLRRLRAREITLPLWLGIPGVVNPAKLIRISTRIGVGDSLRYARKNASRIARLLRPGGARPDRLLRGLQPTLADDALGVAGLHVFCFNEFAATEAWRQELLRR
ncbi:MAG: methylenetetrahydrofolate reductase [Gaiella sp.]